jgi:NitT/TauT family transport system permease protein
MDSKGLQFAASVSTLLVAIGLWHVATANGWVSAFVLPLPSDVARATWGLITTVLACAVGVTVGWLLYVHPLLAQAYEGWFAAAFSAPLVLLYPLFLVIFGRGPQTIIAMAFVAATIPVVLHTSQALRGVPQTLKNLALVLNMTPAQTVWKILFPAALPAIFTGFPALHGLCADLCRGA